MLKQSSTLAKLSQPRLSNPLLRNRLFALFEELRKRPVVAVVGPPGSGKTTLVASYLSARNLPVIWYQVDQGDADAATFFYYLRLAFQEAAPRSGSSLQLLAPEYLKDLPGFSRRFFREFYAGLTVPAVVVFDNFQDVPEDSPFVAIMREALSEIPEGVNVVLCSRSDPPPDFARFVINERMGILDWNELRLSLEEVRQIAFARTPLDDTVLREVYARSDGWAAGVTLMLEQFKRAGRLDFSGAAETKDTVFRYFAGEIFNRASDAMQQLLLRTACCGRVTVKFAEQMTGNPRAGMLLEELYARHYFTYRRADEEVSYVYHALFREFLLDRAQGLWSAEERESHTRRAAALLESTGEADGAVGLYLEGRDYDSATRLILREASQLLSAGRWQTLGTWMRALPGDYVDRTPWLSYWLGTSLIPVNQAEARRLLEHAYRGMCDSDDRLGRLLAAAGVIDAHFFEWSTFRPMDEWIDAITRDLEPPPDFHSPDVELSVYSALLIAMTYRQPGNPLLPRFVDRAMTLLGSGADTNRKVTAGTFLLGYSYIASDYVLAKRVVRTIQPLVDSQALSPLNQVWWRARFAYYSWHLAEYDRALRAIEEASSIANRHGLAGLHSAESLLHWYASLVAFSRNDLDTAEAGQQILERLLKPERRMDVWYLTLARTSLALCKDDAQLSYELAQFGLEVAVQAGMIYIEALSTILLAYTLVRLRKYDEALEATGRVRQQLEHTVLRHLTAEAFFIDAFIALQLGSEKRSIELLKSGLFTAKETGYVFWYRWIPDVLPTLCAKALSIDLESDFVHETIRRFNIPPPEFPVKGWPWPLKLTTFGNTLIEHDGASADLSRRARKPVELLKAIIVCGGYEVDILSIADMLWPDADGDAAQKAFDITLHRLRKQLTDEGALILRRGKISINPKVLWVDTDVFRKLVDHVEVLNRESKLGDVAVLQNLSEMLFDLYRGRFLASDLDLAWAIPVRDRLHAYFLRALGAIGKAWETAGDYQGAISVYLRGLQVDQTAELFYQRLMICYQRSEKLREAMDAYQRCEEALSLFMGRRPSAETEALCRSVSAANSR